MGGKNSKPEFNVVDSHDVDSAMLSAVVALAPNPTLLSDFVSASFKTEKDRIEAKRLAERIVDQEIETSKEIASHAPVEFDLYRKCFIQHNKEHTGCLKEFFALENAMKVHYKHKAEERGRHLADNWDGIKNLAKSE